MAVNYSGNYQQRRGSIDVDGILPFEDVMNCFSTSSVTMRSGLSDCNSNSYRSNCWPYPRRNKGPRGSETSSSMSKESSIIGDVAEVDRLESYTSNEWSMSEKGRGMHPLDFSDASLSSQTGADLELVSECNQKTELDAWEPMITFHDSSQNIKCVDAETTLKGIPHFRGAICPFSKGSTCYKGIRCPCEHHIDNSRLSENPKMAIPVEPVRVTHFSMLPGKVRGNFGAWFFGKVRCVNGINDFYVTPINGIACECCKGDKNYTTKARDGIYTVESITKEMNAYFATRGEKHSSSFSYLELAAVRIMYDGQMGYYRATILESIAVDADEYPESICYLLDIGHNMKVKLNRIHALPKIFCCIPPLAYRCSLYGVSQLQPNVSGKAEEVFIRAVESREVLFRIRRIANFHNTSELGYIETNPYDVDVYAWNCLLKQFSKVANELIQNWYVLPWNVGNGDEIERIGHFFQWNWHVKMQSPDSLGCCHVDSIQFIRDMYFSSTESDCGGASPN